MTESNETDQPNRTAKKLIRMLLLGLAMSFLLANRGCPDDVLKTGCGDIPLRVEPGTCRPFPNPCAMNAQWAHFPDVDGIRLDAQTNEERGLIAAEQVNLKSERTDNGTVRSVCIGAGVPIHDTFTVPYFYAINSSDPFGGNFRLTVAAPLTVVVTAPTTSLALGEHVQLQATASGGIAPYRFKWRGLSSDGLDDFNVANPIATPPFTITYEVDVEDSAGFPFDRQHASGAVTIVVRAPVTVTANPAEIRAGEASQLNAVVDFGTPPYTYSWSPDNSFPGNSLSDPHASSPIARPTRSFRYTVTVTDSLGMVHTGRGQVLVRLEAQASASPASIAVGGTSQLDVVATGGFGFYQYLWSPAASLNDATIRNPIASPSASTTYTVTVTDGQSAPVTSSAAVAVNSSSPPTAVFTYRIGPDQTLVLDARSSTGNIVSYRWELSWTSLSPDLVTSSPTASFSVREIDFGTITLTVTDAAGNTATSSQPF